MEVHVDLADKAHLPLELRFDPAGNRIALRDAQAAVDGDREVEH
jgi:hypothetical protein